MSNHTHNSASSSALAPGLGVESLCRTLRELIAAPAHDADAWTQGAVAALGRAFAPGLMRPGPSGSSKLILEVIEPGTGRCLSAASTGESSVIGAYDPNQERILIDAMGSRGGVLLRVWVPVAAPNGTQQFDIDVRMIATCAVELFESQIWATKNRREKLVARLTEAQRRVLEFMLQDLSEREIGHRLERSQHTIHDHVKGIYNTLGIASRAELLTLWYAKVDMPEPSPTASATAPRQAQQSPAFTTVQ